MAGDAPVTAGDAPVTAGALRSTVARAVDEPLAPLASRGCRFQSLLWQLCPVLLATEQRVRLRVHPAVLTRTGFRRRLKHARWWVGVGGGVGVDRESFITCSLFSNANRNISSELKVRIFVVIK